MLNKDHFFVVVEKANIIHLLKIYTLIFLYLLNIYLIRSFDTLTILLLIPLVFCIWYETYHRDELLWSMLCSKRIPSH